MSLEELEQKYGKETCDWLRQLGLRVGAVCSNVGGVYIDDEKGIKHFVKIERDDYYKLGEFSI